MSPTSDLLHDARRALRVKENFSVRWQINDSQESGQGRVRNISASGILLELDKDFSPPEKSILDLESVRKDNGQFLPSAGRLVWSRSHGPRNHCLCGIEFMEPDPGVISRLRERIQKGIINSANARRLRSVIGFVVMMALTGLLIFLVSQHLENYRHLALSHQIMTEAYEQQVLLSQIYASELVTTKATLVETQTMLAKSQDENANLQILTEELSQRIASLSQTVTTLEQTNADLNSQLADLNNQLASVRERMRLLEGDIKNLEEGRSVMAMYRQTLRKIKRKIHEFKVEAHQARIAAQKEKDRLELLLGNNGYLVKDGRPIPPEKTAAPKAPRVDVDVEMMK